MTNHRNNCSHNFGDTFGELTESDSLPPHAEEGGGPGCNHPDYTLEQDDTIWLQGSAAYSPRNHYPITKGNSIMRINPKLLISTAVVFTVLMADPGAAYGQDTTSQPVAQSNSDVGTDQYIDLLRKDVRSLKKQVVAANLDLSDKEAEKFWPIYDQYTTDLGKINDTKIALIKGYAQNYSTMTDEQAEAYVKGRAAVDESVNRLRLKYFPIFHRVLY